MTTKEAPATEQRATLSRQLILRTALRYVDEHGLEALSMHKLGAELGVRGMSLYNHVAGKDAVLDGIVEVIWGETEREAPAQSDWRTGYRLFARTLRDVVHRHPKAAPLLTARQVIPEPALRSVRDHIASAVAGGVPTDHAYALLRTINSYALGYALAYLSWGLGCPGCAPTIGDLVPPGMPDDLAQVAEVFCGQADPDAQFELGLDLMISGAEHDRLA